MSEYRISRETGMQLDGIYAYSEFRFGAKAGRHLCFGFDADISKARRLAELGKALKGFESSLRRYRFQSHYIFFNVEPDHVLIRAVLHARRNFVTDLTE